MSYLRVENKVSHIPDIDFLCTVGESTSRGNASSIGQFGSGFVYTLALFARNGILEQCKICLGKDVYTPYIDSASKKDSAGNVRPINKIGLKKQNGGSYDLNISTGFGEVDWTDITMGVREIISNAFDGAETFNGKYDSVAIETVGPNQCRAADGVIRVYIPITDEISDYMANIENYFLCLKRVYNPHVKVISKSIPGPCRVYRRGVMIGEFSQHSMFDYNLPDLPVNESRKINSGQAREYSAKAIILDTRDDQLDKFVRDILLSNQEDCNVWEHSFASYDINPDYFSGNDKETAKGKLLLSVNRVMGHRVLCKNSLELVMVQSKGMDGVIPKDDLTYKMLANCGVKKALDILDDSEALGHTVSNPTDRVIAVRDNLWNQLSDLNLTNGRDKPPVHCFNSAVNGMAQTSGYCNSEFTRIYIHEDISQDMGNELKTVMLEELAHYITRAHDCTRDFQSYLLNLAARLMNG